MSVSLWAYNDLKCDGYPCCGSCDDCEIKDEHRCEECEYFAASPWSTYGTCKLDGCAVSEVMKACEDFEELEDE